MDRKKEVQQLRKRQRVYLNLFLFLYIGILIGLIPMINATRGDIYGLLGISFLVAALSRWWYKASPIPSLLRIKELDEWEREKLGDSFHKYHFPGMMLCIILAIYFFMQAALYAGKTPFRDELSLWYFILTPAIIVFVVNLNMTFHARRIDTKTTDELRQYSEEKLLFTKIFVVVSSVFILIGFALVLWLR